MSDTSPARPAQGTTSKFLIPIADSDPVTVSDEPASHRLRCDHPRLDDSGALGKALREAARIRSRSRVMVLCPEAQAPGLQAEGFRREASIPGYYRGIENCVVLGWTSVAQRGLCDDDSLQIIADLRELEPSPPRPLGARMRTEIARIEDCAELSKVLTGTFPCYPTRIDADYLGERLKGGDRFRVIRGEDGTIIACASAETDEEHRAAELTDCVVLPAARRRGWMQDLLVDLAADLLADGFSVVYTFARGSVPGMNRAFQKLGYEYGGTCPKSCLIGNGIEDMHVWSRELRETP